ncbi:MAG: SDR family NAD(P)-dependent oxidoreductase [Aeromicrobium sp.]
MTTVAVIGATSGIANATMRLWAARGADLRLVGRDPERLALAEQDLMVRGAGSVAVFVRGIDGTAAVEDMAQWLFADGIVDVVLIAFGTMPSQEAADADLAVAAELLQVNGTLALLSAQAVALRLIEQGHGALAVIGSVSGDRGRQSNYLYGSAKAMVATGVAGLQHRTAGSPVTVTLVKPGPTETPMTDHLRGGSMALAKVETVARDIVSAVDRGRPVVYTPRKWALIMTIIRLLPRQIFHRTRL